MLKLGSEFLHDYLPACPKVLNDLVFGDNFTLVSRSFRSFCWPTIFETYDLKSKTFQDQADGIAYHTQKGIDYLDKYGAFLKDRAAIEDEYATKLRLVTDHNFVVSSCMLSQG